MPNPCQNYALKAPTSLPDVQDLRLSTSIRMPTSGRLGHVDPVGRFPTYPVSNNVSFELVYEAHDQITLMLILLSWLLIFALHACWFFSVANFRYIMANYFVFLFVHVYIFLKFSNYGKFRSSYIKCWQHFGFCSLLLHHFFLFAPKQE